MGIVKAQWMTKTTYNVCAQCTPNTIYSPLSMSYEPLISSSDFEAHFFCSIWFVLLFCSQLSIHINSLAYQHYQPLKCTKRKRLNRFMVFLCVSRSISRPIEGFFLFVQCTNKFIFQYLFSVSISLPLILPWLDKPSTYEIPFE